MHCTIPPFHTQCAITFGVTDQGFKLVIYIMILPAVQPCMCIPPSSLTHPLHLPLYTSLLLPSFNPPPPLPLPVVETINSSTSNIETDTGHSTIVTEQSSPLRVAEIAAGGLGSIVVVLAVVVAILVVMKLKHSKERSSSYTHGSHATHVTNNIKQLYNDSISLHEIDGVAVSTNPAYGVGTDGVAVSTNPAYGVGTDGVAVSTNPAYGVGTDGVAVSTNPAYGVGTDGVTVSTNPAYGVGADGVAVSTNPAYGVSTDGVAVSTNAAYGVITDEAAYTNPAYGAIGQANDQSVDEYNYIYDYVVVCLHA